MDQALAKRELNALIDNLDLGNKTCCDCENKNPQWASLRCVASHASIRDQKLNTLKCTLSAMLLSYAWNVLGNIGVLESISGVDSLPRNAQMRVRMATEYAQFRPLSIYGLVAGRSDTQDESKSENTPMPLGAGSDSSHIVFSWVETKLSRHSRTNTRQKMQGASKRRQPYTRSITAGRQSNIETRSILV